MVNSLANDVEKTYAPDSDRPLKGRTREVYTKAAMLFRQNGYLDTPLNKIAKELNIQKASLYYYIKDKETLLFEILNRTMDTMLEQVGNLPMQNLDPDECYMYSECTLRDGTVVKVANFFDVGNTPELQMEYRAQQYRGKNTARHGRCQKKI